MKSGGEPIDRSYHVKENWGTCAWQSHDGGFQTVAKTGIASGVIGSLFGEVGLGAAALVTSAVLLQQIIKGKIRCEPLGK